MVIISNGHSKFILGAAAAELNRYGMLDGYLTAGYPTANMRALASMMGIDKTESWKRFSGRNENLPESLIYPIWSAEALGRVAALARGFRWAWATADDIEDRALRIYSVRAAHILRNLDSQIYHYRSGYGHSSVKVAKAKGMITICDHSIAHPATLDYLISNGGKLPPPGISGKMTKFWKHVLDDLNLADHIIVNSDFVKATFMNQGWQDDRIHVAYTGIDDQFLKVIPGMVTSKEPDGPVKLLFAGEFGPRKGAGFLIEALNKIDRRLWQLTIIGHIHPDINERYPNFLSMSNVFLAGTVPRLALAEHMVASNAFVFPSLAEGSARVVFMALACGCTVITTSNSGSIVKDGINGLIVPPGDVNSLVDSIMKIVSDKTLIGRYSASNRELIAKSYRQEHYGLNLVSIYRSLI